MNSPASTGLYNGDLVKVIDAAAAPEVRRVGIKGIDHPIELVFWIVSLAYRDADGQTVRVDCRVLENLLDSPERDLTPVEQRALLVDFQKRYPQLKPKSAEFRTTIRQDSYFNALQVKYGYALTCHKAQGGEWDTAVVNFADGRGKDNEDFFRWTYTAISRAKKTLVTINAPKFDATSSIDWDAVPPAPTYAAPATTGDDPATDPDWNRFSFNRGQKRLFAYHEALRTAWATVGIAVERLDHLLYCERYVVTRQGKHASVQYQYRGNLKVSTTVAVPGSVSDPAILDDALDAMRNALMSAPPSSAPLADTFLMEFRERVERSLDGSGIRLVSTQPMQYRLRREFEESTRRARIDFHYDGKKKWTRAEEVGGPGSSNGIIDRVRALMEQGA